MKALLASSSLAALAALQGLAIQCEPRRPSPPAPLPSASPAPTETAPPPLPEPSPEPPDAGEGPEPTDRCSAGYRVAEGLGCPPAPPPCDLGRDGLPCAAWIDFCRVAEANGISAGSRCLTRAASCAEVSACEQGR